MRVMRRTTRKIVLAALFLALGLVLPFLTGQIPQIGNMLLPMHIPVFLCGMICGGFYGGTVGLILPIMRSLIFVMPAMYPNAIAMAIELCAYGLISGLLLSMLKKRNIITIYISLISAMICGRALWGAAELILLGFGGEAFTWQAFLAGAFVKAVPGIIIQLVIIPVIISATDHIEKKRGA